jgi:hypothetical protein
MAGDIAGRSISKLNKKMTVSREVYESALATIEDMRETIQQLEFEKDELAEENLNLMTIQRQLVNELTKSLLKLLPGKN